MKTNTMTNQKLDLTSTQHTDETTKPPIKQRLKAIWQFLVMLMIKEPELRVWQLSDRRGNTVWHAYDPISGERVIRSSEIDLLAWIEESYYKK